MVDNNSSLEDNEIPPVDDKPSSTVTQQSQEDEYIFPYHYIPIFSDTNFSQSLYWDWGFRYLGGLKAVLNELHLIDFSSLIDIGCGDGRFLSELDKLYPNKDILGVDYSDRAISFAQTFNSHIDYKAQDIIYDPLDRTFDVVTLIEVLEHIPPNLIDKFLQSTRNCMKPEGKLIMTVPHKNIPLIQKHFQHFDIRLVREVASLYFNIEEFIFLDKKPDLLLRIFHKLLGGNGKHFVIRNKFLNSMFLKIYFSKYLYSKSEKGCGRILCIMSGK